MRRSSSVDSGLTPQQDVGPRPAAREGPWPAHSSQLGLVRIIAKNLRHKLGDDAEGSRCILTEARVGYRMEKPASAGGMDA